MKSRRVVAVLILAFWATVAHPQDVVEHPALSDLPHWPTQHTSRVSAVVPPEGAVPESEQWPEAAWLEINDVPFVLYARHLAGYEPATGQGHFAVWLSVPPDHRQSIERTRPMTAGDAHAYLRTAGVNTMTAEVYVGPGDRWGPAPTGSVPWTASTDRLLIAEVEPAQGSQELPAYGLVRVMADGNELARLRITCRCPRYDAGEGREANEEWIAWGFGGQVVTVDQWGLPGNSPLPGDAIGPGSVVAMMDPADADRFAGTWVDASQRVLLSIFGDGTWAQFHTADAQSTPRAGTWGVVDGALRLRASLASPSQLWEPRLDARTARLLTGGDYDLTVVYDLERQEDTLVGTCRSWNVRARNDGDIEAFTAWNERGGEIARVEWQHVKRVYPPIRDAAGTLVTPPALHRMLERVPPTGIGLPAHKQVHSEAQQP